MTSSLCEKERLDSPRRGAIPRRTFLLGLSLPLLRRSSLAAAKLRITALEVFVVPVNVRGDWIFIRLKTNLGLTGLGEASHGFGASRDRSANLEHIHTALQDCFELCRDQSPFDIEAYRRRGWPAASGGALWARTAFSAIEQAHWDLAAKSLGVPVYQLSGGKLRDHLPLYANINRATTDRSPAGFAANAAKAVEEGFASIKAAPFDGFPKLSASSADIRKAADVGVACTEAMRGAIGADRDLMIDCHSNFDVPLATDTAHRLDPLHLAWYEEPVAPTDLEDLSQIRKSVHQRIAAGELLFGMAGFSKLAASGACDILMPDIKYCGGFLEARHIAALAESYGREISPHNPSGPVALAASVQLSAGIPNFAVLEYAWGEVPWRAELITPRETIERGQIRIPETPGFGIELNDKVIARRV